jgi:hypothetical protein
MTVPVSWVPLTPDHLTHCAPLWGDKRAYAPAEFARATARLAGLLQQQRALGAAILEDDQVRGFGVTGFVDPDVVESFLAAPHEQFGKRLLLDDSLGPDVILDRRRIAEGNSRAGLQLVVLNTNYDPDARHPDIVLGSVMASFQAVHRGYRVARIVNEVHGAEAVDVAVTSRSFEVRQRFVDVGGVKGLSGAVLTLTREQAAEWRNPLLAMFAYSPPRIYFTEPEQHILRLALTGAPDWDIAERLRVPETAVKGRWTRIQERAFGAVPELSAKLASRTTATGRGRQNRHLILEYVRQHPSELTPYLRAAGRRRLTAE